MSGILSSNWPVPIDEHEQEGTLLAVFARGSGSGSGDLPQEKRRYCLKKQPDVEKISGMQPKRNGMSNRTLNSDILPAFQ